ncbi:MAG TPA: UDP-glucose/GDP-mannose dehydrogenase family protein [Chloroflexota bacterium]|jgi:UDPglucose 6-dehydrogenase|nr:UDP-glucose/GDP-mannose dehydrogenase family protein [Chloroflexota bacterium]
MANICIVGTGYVGLTTGACFADLGNRVICLDIDREKIANLKRGILPIYEPGLEEMVSRNREAGRLFFTDSYDEGLAEAEFAFIAVDTPPDLDGGADLLHLREAAASIARAMRRPLIVVNKSTVPVGAGDLVADIIARQRVVDVPFSVVSNPEFLREGTAIHDCLNPDRIILGATDRAAAERVARLYQALKAPILITDLHTAEMIKYASNSFLATKISFINEIAAICEKLGADVKVVAQGMGLDRRIGPAFLEAGLGWGGSCFPKDVRALEYMAAANGCHPQLLRAVMDINRDQRRRLVQKLREALGGSVADCRIGILGLSFKPNTDDLRDAPSLTIIRQLLNEGAQVRAYDPVAMRQAEKILTGVHFGPTPYAIADGADALVIVTEWNEFKELDLVRIRDCMARPVIVDGRNVYDPALMAELGFTYLSIGRPPVKPAAVQPARAAS